MMVLLIYVELILKNIVSDKNIYKKDELKNIQIASKYKYKDMLYKELIELADI